MPALSSSIGTDLRYSVATPASAMQENLSRLLLLSCPLFTSVWNSLSQNCVPAWTFSARNLQRHRMAAAGKLHGCMMSIVRTYESGCRRHTDHQAAGPKKVRSPLKSAPR